MQRAIVNFFNGRKREEELKEEELQDPELKDAIRIWNSASKDTNYFCPDADKAWSCVAGKIRNKSNSASARFFYWAAASIGIILGAYFAFDFYLSPSTLPEVEIVAHNNEVTEAKLSDGSTVWINAGGSISYDPGNPRAISLKGEAFFQVTHHQESPFVVESSGVRTTVLGTEFNINDRSDVVTIDVLSGKVEINALNKTVLATPHTRITVSREENTVTKTASTGGNFLFWKTGLLEFHDTPLAQILDQINYHYKSDVKAISQLSQCRLTLSLNKMTLEESLDVIATLVDGTVKKQGAAYTIHGQDCKQVK